MNFDAVLFDWGHTLFETGSSIEFVTEWAAEQGRPLERHTVDTVWESARIRSRTPEELAKGRDISPELHRSCWLELWAGLDTLCPGIAEALYAHETSADGWQPYQDAREVLEALADAGIPVVVVSDVAFDLRPIFDHYEMRHLVRDFVLSGEHGSIKPSGELFRIALETVHVTPARALMVGDNPANDGAASAAGITTLLLPVPPTGHSRNLALVLPLVGL